MARGHKILFLVSVSWITPICMSLLHAIFFPHGCNFTAFCGLLGIWLILLFFFSLQFFPTVFLFVCFFFVLFPFSFHFVHFYVHISFYNYFLFFFYSYLFPPNFMFFLLFNFFYFLSIFLKEIHKEHNENIILSSLHFLLTFCFF